MLLRIEDYVNKPRDSKRERILTGELRKLPEEDRSRFIQSVLLHDRILGLKLASSCLQQKRYFKDILIISLELADASEILLWLKCLIPKLGFRRVISILGNEVDSRPGGVAKALYWLPQLLPANDTRAQLALEELTDVAKAKGYLRRPKILPHPGAADRVLFDKIDD